MSSRKIPAIFYSPFSYQLLKSGVYFPFAKHLTADSPHSRCSTPTCGERQLYLDSACAQSVHCSLHTFLSTAFLLYASIALGTVNKTEYLLSRRSRSRWGRQTAMSKPVRFLTVTEYLDKDASFTLISFMAMYLTIKLQDYHTHLINMKPEA